MSVSAVRPVFCSTALCQALVVLKILSFASSDPATTCLEVLCSTIAKLCSACQSIGAPDCQIIAMRLTEFCAKCDRLRSAHWTEGPRNAHYAPWVSEFTVLQVPQDREIEEGSGTGNDAFTYSLSETIQSAAHGCHLCKLLHRQFEGRFHQIPPNESIGKPSLWVIHQIPPEESIGKPSPWVIHGMWTNLDIIPNLAPFMMTSSESELRLLIYSEQG